MADTSSRRTAALDATLLLSIPTLLIAIHFLTPTSIQNALAFDHTRFNVYTLLTAAYVHASNFHLYSNLLGYALTTTYTYTLCLHVDERQWFRRTLPVHLLVLPILINLTSYAIFTLQYPRAQPVTRGFSGVVGGLGGFLLVALYVFVKNRHDGELAYAVGLTTFLLLMQLIDFRYAGGLQPSVTGLVLLGSGLVFGRYLLDGVNIPEGKERRDAVISGVAVGLVAVVLGVLVLGLFPDVEALVEGGTFTNVFAHATGFVLGIVASVVSWYGPDEAIKTVLAPFYDFFLIVAVSVGVTFLFGLSILVLYIYTGIRLPGVPTLRPRAPVFGLSIAFASYALAGIYQNSIEKEGWLSQCGDVAASILYRVAYHPREDKPDKTHERDAFVDFAIRVPAILLLIPIIYGALAVYFGLIVPLQPLALIFIGLGVIAGVWGDGIGRSRAHLGGKHELKQEAKEAVTSQLETFFLITGSFLQFIIFLDIKPTNVVPFAIWTSIVVSLAIVSVYLTSKLGLIHHDY